MSTPTSIHHGLSVLSDADASQRLAHPLDDHVWILGVLQLRSVSNFFNDASTGRFYGDKTGHPGIDYLCDIGNDVKAMYGGIVTDASTDSGGSKNVRIESWTKWNSTAAGRLGFRSTYAHLDSFSVAAGNVVKKGQVIGRSGNTGADNFPHLHVEFQAFASNGQVTGEYCPPKAAQKDTSVYPKVTVAQRIRGGMNFACFLPADNNDVPDITQALLNRGTGKLLSVRVGYPYLSASLPLLGFVPVYTTEPMRYDGIVSTPHSDWLPNSQIGCYAIQGEKVIASHNLRRTYKLYRIQWKDGQEALVPHIRKHKEFSGDVETVHVEAASTPALPSQAVVHTEQSALYVSSSPFQYKLPNWGLPAPNSLGALTADQGYVITGTHVDRASAWPGVTDSVVEQARRRW